MITLFLLACQTEWLDVDKNTHIVRSFLDAQSKSRSNEDLWVEQCVARKEAGL